MFTSKQHLHDNLGVDKEIAAFFVDRKVPQNNSYWKGRYLYVAGGTGYLFIPIFFDLQFRAGLSKEKILDEGYVRVMEDILNSAAGYEFKQIGFYEHIEKCKEIVRNIVRNESLYNDLVEYFKNENLVPFKNLGTFSKALNRGDTFLFLLCSLDTDEALTQKIINLWYALIPSFLLMDDITDLNEDKDNNEENAIRDFGPGNAGVEEAIIFLRQAFDKLKTINNKLGQYFEKSLDRKVQTPYLQSILNDQNNGTR